MTSLDTGIATRKTVSEMVAAYKLAAAKIEAGYAQVYEAQDILESAFGEHYSDFSCLPDRCYSSTVVKDVMTRLKRAAWRSIIHKLEIRKVMSIKRVEELDKRLENEDLPPIEEATVFDILKDFVDSADGFALDAVKEVFDYLRPGAHEGGWQHSYKTNTKNGKFELGKKIILSWMVRQSYDRRAAFNVQYDKEKYLLAIDHIFALLDGKATGDKVSYKSPLVDAINTSQDGYGETDYFKFRAYLNMNLHLEFKRMDLVAMMNQIAGNGTLKE